MNGYKVCIMRGETPAMQRRSCNNNVEADANRSLSGLSKVDPSIRAKNLVCTDPN